jgi:hypothetical protein
VGIGINLTSPFSNLLCANSYPLLDFSGAQ